MEIYCLHGIGVPSERSYVYNEKDGVYSVEGDESTVAVVSSGFMCAKGWRGRTRFNPSGMATYIREYQHKQPGSLLEWKGIDSGAGANIMGNIALIEDVLRVAAGATGGDIGGDRIFSDIMRISERINLRL